MIRFIQSKASRFLRDESGTATVEFCIMFPPIVFLFVLGVESGLLMTRNVMLERALDIVVRELRLDKIPRDGNGKVPVETVRDLICANTIVFPRCKETLVLNMEPVNMTTWVLPTNKVPCLNGEKPIKPASDLWTAPTSANEVMLIRACIEADPVWGAGGMMAGLKKSKNGTYWVTSISAFVNEPT